MKNEWKNIPDPIVKKRCLLKSSFQGCVLFDFDVPSKILQIAKGYEFGMFFVFFEKKNMLSLENMQDQKPSSPPAWPCLHKSELGWNEKLISRWKLQ